MYVFQISKLITFEVNFYTLGTNSAPYFSTSANEFCRSKLDYTRGGQAQRDLLPKFSRICVSFLFAIELEIESTRLWEEAEARSKVGIKLKHNDY